MSVEKMKPLLSIIIPYYNGYQFLPTLLDSIPESPEIETIIVNDHSTEPKQYFERIKVQYHRSNLTYLENDSESKGAGTARNKGVLYARGRYIMFADADDWFLEDFYPAIVEYLRGDADIVYFPPVSVGENGKLSDRHIWYSNIVNDYYLQRTIESDARLRYQFYSPCSKLIRTEIIVKNNIHFDDVKYSNDIMFSAKVGFYSQKIYASNRSIYCIYEHGGSLTSEKDKLVLQCRKKVYCRYYDFLRKNVEKSLRHRLGYSWRSDLVNLKNKFEIKLFEVRNGVLP